MSDKAKGNLFVAVQFVLIGLLVFLPGGSAWPKSGSVGVLALLALVGGMLFTVAGILGLGRSLTANPVPLERAELKTKGVYAVVRHPIYLGLEILSFGLAVGSGSYCSAASFVGLAVLFSLKARFEERLLLAKFAGYAEYAARVGRIIPGVGRIR